MIRRDVLVVGMLLAAVGALSAGNVSAQNAAPGGPKALKAGDILSGQLNAIRTRGGKGKNRGKRAPVFQLVSEPRRLPPPGGLCNLETGPETFQILTATDAQASQLKPLIGKSIALKVEEIGCAEEAGVMSEAIVTKWSLAR